MINLAALLRELYPIRPPGLHLAQHTLRQQLVHGPWLDARLQVVGQEISYLKYVAVVRVIPQLLWATPAQELPGWVTGD
ncbi:hypothetical protein [Deinococcus arboris]|nr:hypothetical protein [Deinococcus arboris]